MNLCPPRQVNKGLANLEALFDINAKYFFYDFTLDRYKKLLYIISNLTLII